MAPSNSSTGKKRGPNPSSAPKPPPSKKRRSTSTPPSQNSITASTPGSKTPATPVPADSTKKRRGIANYRKTETQDTLILIRKKLLEAEKGGRKAPKYLKIRDDKPPLNIANYTLPEVPNWDLLLEQSLLYSGRRCLPRDHPRHDEILMDCADGCFPSLDTAKRHTHEDLLKKISGMIKSRIDVDSEKFKTTFKPCLSYLIGKVYFDKEIVVDEKQQSIPAATTPAADDNGVNFKGMMEGIVALSQTCNANIKTLSTEFHGNLNAMSTEFHGNLLSVTQSLGKVTSTVAVHGEQLQEHGEQLQEHGEQLQEQNTKVSAMDLKVENLKLLVESNRRLTESFQKEWSLEKEQLSRDRRSAAESTLLFAESSPDSSTASSWAGASPSSLPPVDENKEFVGVQVAVADAASLPPKTPKWHPLLRLKPTNDDKKELTSKEKRETRKFVRPFEADAIAAYIKGSGNINDQLRGKEEVTPETNELVHYIGQALAVLPPCQGTVYRVTKLAEATIREMLESGEFKDKAFLSCSELHYSHQNLLSHKSNSNCCFTIVSKTGRSIIGFSDKGCNTGEHEVLFLPNTKFSVKSYTMDDEMHHFEMEEIVATK